MSDSVGFVLPVMKMTPLRYGFTPAGKLHSWVRLLGVEMRMIPLRSGFPPAGKLHSLVRLLGVYFASDEDDPTAVWVHPCR